MRKLALVDLLVLAIPWMATQAAHADDLPKVEGVPAQPLVAQVRRLVEALELQGQPLPVPTRAKLDEALGRADPADQVRAIQDVLDPLCLLGVTINPEGRVGVARGAAPAILGQNEWRAFPVKVHNEARVTSELKVASPNAEPVFRVSTNQPTAKPGLTPADVADRWMDVSWVSSRPMLPKLGGLRLEYRLLQIYSRDAAPREARLKFDIGAGTQDLGFRGDLDILFTGEAAVPVTLEVLDVDGRPTTASFTIRDASGRSYPSANRRLAPDFWFQPQVYRRSGETIELAPGRYTIKVGRGPEYEVESRMIEVPKAPLHRESFNLKRWIDPAGLGWYSGDHHIHAAGCGHYERPTEGVRPIDMIRHVEGEALNVGCVLTWGPCWYAQKSFFEAKDHALSTPGNLMRYDVEVSGFPSSASGHLVLLRLQEDDYPGTTEIQDWPTWNLPIARWAKSQGAVVGYAHTGFGLKTADNALPSRSIPQFDGVGAMEYVVDVTHDAIDFLSTVDSPAPWELNLWYHALNCGFRTRIGGETDFPCLFGERVGVGRSYVRPTDGVFSFDRWVEGLKEGRSYVSDGKSQLVDFRLDDVRVGEGGSERKLDGPGPVRVSAKVAALLDPIPSATGKAIKASPLEAKPYWDLERARMGESRLVPVEVVVNGKPAGRVSVIADGTFHDVSLPVQINRSSWVALRIYPSSHTNPVFVSVGGQPIRASKASAQWCLQAVDRCWLMKSGSINPSQLREAREAYDFARASYRKILEESAED